MHEKVVATSPEMPVGSDFANEFTLRRVDFNVGIQKEFERSFDF
jgi:hypothetical protein